MAKKNEAKKKPETKKEAIVRSTAGFLTGQSDMLKTWCVEGSGLTPVELVQFGTKIVAQEEKFHDERVWPSLYLALLTSAQLGLKPNGVFGEGFIIPYWNPKLKHFEAQFQPGFRGLVKLVLQSGEAKSMRSIVAYSGDDLLIREGTDPGIHHIIHTGPDRGVPVGAYSIVEWADETNDHLWCPQADIDRARQDTPAWKVWPDEMARKFALKRHSKQLPMSPRALIAIAADNAQRPTEFNPETGEVIDVEVVEETTKPTSGLEKKLEDRKKSRTKPASKPEAKPEPAKSVSSKAADSKGRIEHGDGPPPILDDVDFAQCELCGESAADGEELCGPCRESVDAAEGTE